MKKVVSQIVLTIILQDLLHMIHIKSVVNKNKNKYYYNIFSEKGSYKDRSNTEYF